MRKSLEPRVDRAAWAHRYETTKRSFVEGQSSHGEARVACVGLGET